MTTERMGLWDEYDNAAEWCAKHNLKGSVGDALPHLLAGDVADEINRDPEAFERRVRAFAYALVMGPVDARQSPTAATPPKES